VTQNAQPGTRVLLVDLNNFARYPTVAVGLLTAILREAEFEVEVLSPLAFGVPGLPREARAAPWGAAEARLRYATAVSRNPVVSRVRSALVARRHPIPPAALRTLVASLEAKLALGCDAVLISTYLMYFDACREIARVCAERGVPVIIGGSYFFQPEVAREWTQIPGVSGVVGGEVEPYVADIVRALVEGGKLGAFPGVWVDGGQSAAAPPLTGLDRLPFPDYSDFPWHRYPNRIVPMVTGRGCAWGVCTFCSDVTSTAGRSFRSRGAGNVLDELEFQARRHDTDLFVFTDLKLNSDAAVWSALLAGARTRVPSARWIGAVHVSGRRPDGVSLTELRAAKAAGMVRLTTGLESGSQRVLDEMRKGTDLDTTRRFLADAAAAELSVRLTMILGYPGERAADVAASAAFVEQNEGRIDRILLNRFALMTGTRLHRKAENAREDYPDLETLRPNHRMAVVDHDFGPARERSYRRQVSRLISAVHRVNRRPIRESARAFEGVM
jgi:anaerobic magnesium-protoporphyrin IX monomethyl ester cyclase